MLINHHRRIFQMRKTLAHFSTRVLIPCGILALGFQLPTYAQDINLSVSPSPVVGTAHQTATVTILVESVVGTGLEARGVTVSFEVPKGLKVSVPSNCVVTRAQGSSSVVC